MRVPFLMVALFELLDERLCVCPSPGFFLLVSRCFTLKADLSNLCSPLPLLFMCVCPAFVASLSMMVIFHLCVSQTLLFLLLFYQACSLVSFPIASSPCWLDDRLVRVRAYPPGCLLLLAL